jgi:uncharacterized protein (DUF1810 family)
MKYSVERFIDAQKRAYQIALTEIKNGRKQGHWMWYIFPQIQGLGFSEMSKYYSIKNIDEATIYLNHPILGSRLYEISNELLKLTYSNAMIIFGSPDDLKLKSSMTLFSQVEKADVTFKLVLDKYFGGSYDERTIQLLKRRPLTGENA